MTTAVNWILSNIGVPGIVALAGAGLVAWRLIRDAKKPALLLALLAMAGATGRLACGGFWLDLALANG